MTRVCVFVPLCLFLSSLHHVFGAEVSLWNIIINNNEPHDFVFRKTLYSNTSIFLKFQGEEAACNQKKLAFNVSWYLRSSICYNEVFGTPDSAAETMLGSDHMLKEDWSGFYSQGYIYFNSCSALLTPMIYYKEFHPFLPLKPQEDKSIIQTRHVLTDKPYFNMVAKSWTDSPYLFIVRFEILQHPDESNGRRETEDAASNSNYLPVTMTVEMKGSHDYSSPADRPLMMFFMTMCIVYVLFGALWLLWLACYWRDLLRIQFYIGAVIVLGMLEKAVFYSEYQRITYHGAYNQDAVIFAELVSALKRSLARVLLIIVSLGYGIVKPRLGTTVPKLVAVGLLYLIFSSVEGVLRVTGGFYGTLALIASLSLSITDSCVIWWHIFISLSQTTRLLKLRRNVVKLSLYRHFTKTLIFSVLASIIFLVWTTRQFKFVDCQSGWRDLWVDDAFWRLLFSTILLVIMVLLRPSINSQRFSHSPLIDEDDEEDAKEPMLNEAFEGMKMRGAKSEANSSKKDFNKDSSQDEDLKWVEENIPTSAIDVSLPVILDDEEELLKTKLERSKME